MGGTSRTNKCHAIHAVNDLFIWVDAHVTQSCSRSHLACATNVMFIVSQHLWAAVRNKPGCQLWKSQCTELTLSQCFSPILSYINTLKISVRMEKQVQWACGHVCGETGGYLEQRQGWVWEATWGGHCSCVCVCTKGSRFGVLAIAAGRCSNYTIWTQKASFSTGGGSKVAEYSD